MAHSIQSVGNKVSIVNDADLLLLLGLMLEQVNRSPEKYPALTFMVPTWNDALNLSGPGTVDLELERLAQSPGGERDLFALLSAALTRANELGPTIPADVLNEHYHVPGLWFRDFDVSLLERAAQALRDLFEPRP